MQLILLLTLLLLAAEAYEFGVPHVVAEGGPKPAVKARQQTDGRFTFFSMPTPLSGPCDLAYNPVDGNLYGEQQLINQLFMINPRSGEVTEYPIPFTTPASNATIDAIGNLFQGPLSILGDRLALSCAIRDGADGNIYASNGVRNQLVQLNTRTKRIKIFQNPPNPLGNGFPFNDIYTDKEGMWVTQTTSNVLQYFEYRRQSFTFQRQIPTPLSLPLGAFVASDGLVYGCEVIGNKIFTYNKRTDQFREYPLPLPLQTPAVVRSEKNGWVYFSLLTGNGLGRINMRTKKIELYPSEQNPGGGSVTTGPSSYGRGGVWMSYFLTTNALARFDDRTLTYSYVPFPDTFAEFGLPGAIGNVPPYMNIAVNWRPGNALWFGSFQRNAVGRYQLKMGE